MAIIMDGMYIQDIIQNDIPLTELWCNGVKVWPENKDITYMWIIPEEDVTISYVVKDTGGSPATSVTKDLLYSFDASTWNSLTSNGISVSAKTVLYFKSNTTDGFGVYETNPTAWQYKGIRVQNSSQAYGNYIVGGNMNSLFNGSLSVPARGLAYFFGGEWGMKTARLVLPMTTLGEGCYFRMFKDCQNLTSAPALPATTLADSCYYYMFSGCIRLANAPTSLPATSLSVNCYNLMFENCAITKGPSLPATSLAVSCYAHMFYGCGKLRNAPSLPATTMEASCYSEMFRGCSSLTTAPALPATTLAPNCYDNIFNRCSSLMEVPELPATVMQSSCYYGMFNKCSALKFSTTQTAECPNAYRIPVSGSGTTATDWNKFMFNETGGTFTGNPTIDTTYYTNATVV